MSRGVLLFAIDTADRSYTKMAEFCAKKIKTHTDLSVTVVSNTYFESPWIDTVKTVEYNREQTRGVGNTGVKESWKNFNRYHAYQLSPYDETVLMDTDYICNSGQIMKLFEFNSDVMCHRRRIYLGEQPTNYHVEKFGKNFDMYWATVLYFNRSAIAENLFYMMGMIQNNYTHYSHLYGFRPVPYRNDYSLSIALSTVYGHVIPGHVEIPWPLMNVEFATDVKLNDDSSELKFTRRVDNQIKNFRITTSNQDLHVLNKSGLMENI